MRDAIMIRVTAEEYSRWFTEHSAAREARSEYGITDGPLYRDEQDPTTVLVHMNVEDLERAKRWFSDERFKAGVARAGTVQRDIYFATPASR
jgi:heme-degrading monooxygenase HmoA